MTRDWHWRTDDEFNQKCSEFVRELRPLINDVMEGGEIDGLIIMYRMFTIIGKGMRESIRATVPNEDLFNRVILDIEKDMENMSPLTHLKDNIDAMKRRQGWMK